MTSLQKASTAVLAILLLATATAWWQTAPPPAVPAPPKSGSTAPKAASDTAEAAEIVDESSIATAQRLAPLASDAQEQSLAQAALKIADHELDLALTAALSHLEAHPPRLSAEAAQVEARLEKSEALLESDQKQVAALSAELARAPEKDKDRLQEELELVRSQAELDHDEIEEASQDLEDVGGNLRQRIGKLVQQHASAEHARVAAAPIAAAAATPRGLVYEWQTWLAQRRKQALLADAEAGAAGSASGLSSERRSLAVQLEAEKSGVAELAHHSKRAKDVADGPVKALRVPHSHDDAAALLGRTRQIAADQKVVALLDERILDQRQLSGLYHQWGAAAALKSLATAHALLAHLAIVLAVLALLLFLDRWLLRLFGRSKFDRRQLETLRSVTRVALQVIAVLIILFMIIGLPDQFGTVLGIVGAGLTVALKDFIVAFIGWFVLMGKNGIGLGDWVEINGVSGEVIELGMFHTVLLETGNWSDAGHPTGRRVTFTNSFAIEGHYFNFSTSGQWLWDELQVVVPAGRDPYPIVDALSKKVLAATADSAREAEQEWQRAVPAQRGRAFSGVPGINIKPVVGGVEIAVRYITRANERFMLRAKLYQAAVDLLGGTPAASSSLS